MHMNINGRGTSTHCLGSKAKIVDEFKNEKLNGRSRGCRRGKKIKKQKKKQKNKNTKATGQTRLDIQPMIKQIAVEQRIKTNVNSKRR